jgi:hypothetical protein
MQAALQQFNSHGYMKMRRGADDGGIKPVPIKGWLPVRGCGHPVGLGDGGKKLLIGITAGHDCPPRLLKATEMALANTTRTDNQYFIHHWKNQSIYLGFQNL